MILVTGEMMNPRYALLGASKGLGKEFHQLVSQHECLAVSRTLPVKMDFSKEDQWTAYLEQIQKFQPTHIIYFAAGGPYGNFSDKEWKDHKWALKVSFEFPAFLLHNALQQKWSNLQQLVLLGSSVAESEADPKAASYCAAKHALKGLVKTVQKEGAGSLDLRLFSPPYMDTDMLPKNAWPRQSAQMHSPKDVAQQLLSWSQNSNDANGHLVI